MRCERQLSDLHHSISLTMYCLTQLRMVWLKEIYLGYLMHYLSTFLKTERKTIWIWTTYHQNASNVYYLKANLLTHKLQINMYYIRHHAEGIKSLILNLFKKSILNQPSLFQQLSLLSYLQVQFQSSGSHHNVVPRLQWPLLQILLPNHVAVQVQENQVSQSSQYFQLDLLTAEDPQLL